MLSLRTSIDATGIVGINIKTDNIYYYPFIYWPLTKNLLQIQEAEIRKINNYLTNGGMIFFDVVGFSRSNLNLKDKKFQEIREFLSSININSLSPIPLDHTLTKSFYLLKNFPGRWDNRILLIENSNLDINDGVSSIILGFNDWASAWAIDKTTFHFFLLFQEAKDKEMAYRFGINITMYALTGNYKSDQIHSKSILKRLSKPN